MDGCVPANYADGPKLRGVINIIDEKINIQSIPHCLNHCMKPNKIEFNEAKSEGFKFQGQV